MNLSIPDDVVFRDLAGEAVILNLATGVYFGLNEVGTRMWQLLAADGSQEQIVASLLVEYEVEETRLREDVSNLLKQLMDKGLVVKTDAEKNPQAG